jgi:hypothetical protein
MGKLLPNEAERGDAETPYESSSYSLSMSEKVSVSYLMEK